MQYLRSIFFSYLLMPVLTLLICIPGLPSLLLPRRIFMGVIQLWVSIESFFERHILGLRYEIRGQEHLPADGPFIVAAKHQSTYETYKLHELFKDPAIILKKELLSIPLWGAYLKKSGVIAIDRSSPQKAAASVRMGAIAMAEAGRTIVIFPQGTRVKPGLTANDVSYKPGVYRIQEATQLPIVPMALNSGMFWPKGAVLKKRGTVVFEFLPPIEAGLGRQELMDTLETALEGKSNALMAEAQQLL